MAKKSKSEATAPATKTESKSAKIRRMFFDENMTKGEIAKELVIRPQFAYNVVKREEDKRKLAALEGK